MFKPYVSFSQLSYSFIFFFFYIPFSTGSKKPLFINYLPPSQSATIEQPSPQALRQAPTILFLVCDINHPYRNMADHILLEDIFEVKQLDPDGKKFDKVSRIVAVSQQFELGMQLDVNTEVYPLRVDDKFTMALAPTLSPDGTPDTGYYMPGARKSLADKYEYVMHGKLYKIAEDSSDGKVKVEVYASFGGLLMQLRGEPSHLTHFELDQRIFLLMRKV